VNDWWGTTATTSIFVAAAITDWLDGYLARKVFTFVGKDFFYLFFPFQLSSVVTYFFFVDNLFQMDLGSAFGAFLDPVADKVLFLSKMV